MAKLIEISHASPVPGGVTLTLNRPEKRNSLSRDLMSALVEALDAAEDDPELHVIVLAGAGPAFCAGHDLGELTAHRADADRGREFYAATMEQCAAMMQRIVRCPKPVIARVHGIATAAGCQLVASCDLAIAAEEARLATPGVNIGLFCSTPMVALSRNVSRKHAMQMLLTGEMLPAAEAARIGLVNKAVPAGELDAEIARWVETIVGKSQTAVTIGKEAFYHQLEMSLEEAYRYTSGVMVENMLAQDAEEGISAFLEKRPPKWKGR